MASTDDVACNIIEEPKKARAKIKLEFPEKLFYELVLADWKKSCSDSFQQRTIQTALVNTRRFPININGYSELRKIKGIGEHIATRLDAAWKYACENHFLNEEPSLSQVKSVKKGDALQFLESGFVAKGKRDAVPFLPRSNEDNNSPEKTAPQKKKRKRKSGPNVTGTRPPKMQIPNETGSNTDDLFLEGLATLSSSQKIPTSTQSVPTSTQTVPTSTQSVPSSTSKETVPEFLSYDPLDFALCQLVLVVDGREQNNKSRFKTMSQHLEKCTVAHELRPLSVGDYLWIVKLANGKEMVLDYIIERKTWDDLKSSIRQTRYAEQKLRLKDSGIRNVIMVAEGMPQQDRSLEQALVTTSIDNRFLVHRTMNTQGTAKFLQSLTNYLLTRLKRERMYGPSFSYLQDSSRKTKTLTVSDCWLRQLTVCPMVSTERAVQISAIFPTMHSIVEFYRNRANAADSGDITMLLHNEYPETISKSISAQLSKFFCSALQ
ncbi:ERCC4 domain-containing protein [Ditylenchus destructor]|nr:ERCC4 domain-containing protein [Ditylenchus destructor]